MLKLLKLLMLLSGPRRYTLAELGLRFEQSERTVQRHLVEIENAGFILERKKFSGYKLKTDSPAFKSLRQLLHFSDEEAVLLLKTMDSLKGNSPIKERLVGKLNALYDFRALSQIESTNTHETINLLGKAINERKQVLIKAYRSGNSDSITDRIAEPFDFMSDYNGVWCYDTETQSCKQFKITRMEEVEILNRDAVHADKHRIPFTDAFRMSAPAPIATVKARLTLKAYNLLLEEYPLAENYLQKQENEYLLDLPVADFNGVGRFVMGLPGEVVVDCPEAFKNFLKERIKYFGR